jgi:hypothetical protein
MDPAENGIGQVIGSRPWVFGGVSDLCGDSNNLRERPPPEGAI